MFGDQDILQILMAQLTQSERQAAIVYVADSPVSGGTVLSFPRTSIQVPWEATLAFIDDEPLANWGHRCRYVIIRRSDGQAVSIDAQFPPFGPADQRSWHVAYKASAVPDSVIPPLDHRKP